MMKGYQIYFCLKEDTDKKGVGGHGIFITGEFPEIINTLKIVILGKIYLVPQEGIEKMMVENEFCPRCKKEMKKVFLVDKQEHYDALSRQL